MARPTVGHAFAKCLCEITTASRLFLSSQGAACHGVPQKVAAMARNGGGITMASSQHVYHKVVPPACMKNATMTPASQHGAQQHGLIACYKEMQLQKRQQFYHSHSGWFTVQLLWWLSSCHGSRMAITAQLCKPTQVNKP